ncbi:tetratricopeptide repeat protein [Rubinisphaera margarita]|uniref:tetratricopeptide repeat protein n=1 Tax=Rubinisphaera margarita TaxID=2909586 RepID=UPI001EE867DC|nr:tetratricopeptide repeat protein [Rubinisphaera margarita]MCG6157994.1 tetratricopeptide repeat protein [Rubinisphaera margarita]
MTVILRLLTVLVALEVVGAVYWVSRPSQEVPSLVPPVSFSDPVYESELRELSANSKPADPEAARQLAEALVGHGFYAYAEHAYRRALTADENDMSSQFGLAFCLDRTGRIAESTEAYRKVTAMEPRTESEQNLPLFASYSIGRNLLREQNAEAAEALFRQKIRFPPARYQLAKLQIRSGRAAEGLQTLGPGLDELPYSLGLHHLRFRALQQLDQPQRTAEAARLVERSAYLLPINFSTDLVRPFTEGYGFRRDLAVIDREMREGQTQSAEQHLLELRDKIGERKIPQYVTVRLTLGDIYLRSQRANELEQLASELAAFEVRPPELLLWNAGAAAFQDRLDEAADYWHQALLIDPDMQVHMNLKDYFRNQGDAEKSAWHSSRALVLQGRALYRSNRPEQADALFQQAVEEDPQNAEGWFFHAEMNHDLGNTEVARAAYQKCLEIDPLHGRAVRALGTLRDDSP